MNRERVKELIPVLQAYAESKVIQYKVSEDSRWIDCGPNQTLDFNYYHHEFRIKPSPTYRPWRPEEVPFGKLIRTTGADSWHVILSIYSGQSINAGVSFRAHLSNLDSFEWSNDNGKTWQPCGILET